MNRIPLVIDTDPGVDDFFCLALACTYDDVFDLKGVCSMGGNHYTDVTTQNALNILSLFGRDDVPVARGADRYLTRTLQGACGKVSRGKRPGKRDDPHVRPQSRSPARLGKAL